MFNAAWPHIADIKKWIILAGTYNLKMAWLSSLVLARVSFARQQFGRTRLADCLLQILIICRNTAASADFVYLQIIFLCVGNQFTFRRHSKIWTLPLHELISTGSKKTDRMNSRLWLRSSSRRGRQLSLPYHSWTNCNRFSVITWFDDVNHT